MSIQWQDSLNTGVAMIDTQHQELFRRINALLDAMSQGKGRTVVGETLDFLNSYVQTHFRDEQALMIRVGFPGYDAHKLLHERFTADATRFAEEFARTGATSALVLAVNSGVAGWLRQHIMTQDTLIGQHIRSRPQ